MGMAANIGGGISGYVLPRCPLLMLVGLRWWGSLVMRGCVVMVAGLVLLPRLMRCGLR